MQHIVHVQLSCTIQLSQHHNVLSIRHCTAREREGEGVHYTLDWQTMTIIDCDQLYYMRKGLFVCIVLYYVMYM